MGASANIHGASSAHNLCGSDDVYCASDNIRSTCGTDLHSANIHGTSSTRDCGSDDVYCASDNLHSACGYIGFGAGDIISERDGTDNLFHASDNLFYASYNSSD